MKAEGLTPGLGTVAARAPLDAQPPNLGDELCGGHRRKPPSEDNDEDEQMVAGADGDTGSANAIMLSNLKPAAGKFVLGPPVDTTPPIVVFTGPADNPDRITETVAAKPKKHKNKTASKPADGDKSPAKKTSKSAKKPKVSTASH